MTGEGVWAQLLRRRFDTAVRRLGFVHENAGFDFSRFRPPQSTQRALF
jgi:hypothetical protein